MDAKKEMWKVSSAALQLETRTANIQITYSADGKNSNKSYNIEIDDKAKAGVVLSLRAFPDSELSLKVDKSDFVAGDLDVEILREKNGVTAFVSEHGSSKEYEYKAILFISATEIIIDSSVLVPLGSDGSLGIPKKVAGKLRK